MNELMNWNVERGRRESCVRGRDGLMEMGWFGLVGFGFEWDFLGIFMRMLIWVRFILVIFAN